MEPDPAQNLTDLARALLDGLRARRPLASILREHQQASNQLVDAWIRWETGELSKAPDVVPPPEPGPAASISIGHYRVTRELGRGGQAVVYEAVDTRLARRVALKVVHKSLFGTNAAMQRFRAEAMITSRLDHPGICPVYEIGEIDDCLFLAMRLVEGETLAAAIARSRPAVGSSTRFELGLVTPASDPPVSPRSRGPTALLHFFESAAGALDAAHQAGVVHRDVKPGNLMIQADGSAVVLDFGMAADAHHEGAALTRTGDVFGTPAYMAPEQCRGERIGDARVDVFALGASLFEALTGERAFAADSAEATMRLILAGRIPDPRRHRPNLPREIAVVVGKALDPEPARRYGSCAAFAEDLRRIRQLRPILAEPPGVWLRGKRWIQRNPWLTGIAAVTVLAAGTVIWSLRQEALAAGVARDLGARERLRKLDDAYRGLWPITARTPQIVAWLDEANALRDRLPEYRRRLEDLRATALPRTADDVERDQASHPDLPTVRRLEQSLASFAARRGSEAALARHANLLPQHEATLATLRQQIANFRTYRFDRSEDLPLHDSLVAVVGGIEALHAPNGLVAVVERALVTAAAPAAATWQGAIEEIRSAERYGGLALHPQAGLAPLGKDPVSQLWEFVMLESGEPPTRGDDGRLQITKSTGIVLVLLPATRTRIGAAQDRDSPRFEPERGSDLGIYEVDLAPFFIGKYEITQSQWERLGGGRPSAKFPKGDADVMPVQNIDWPTAFDVLERHGLTLPTEAQWEYAARGGSESMYWSGPDLASLSGCENLADLAYHGANLLAEHGADPCPWDDRHVYTAPIGSFRPNPFGLYDVLGNVKEWCLDPMQPRDAYLFRADDGLLLGDPTTEHAVRSGAYSNGPNWVRVTVREWVNGWSEYWGVRACRPVDR